ncbi:IS4 family transposase [Paracoccus sp. (in: a-proteobacteria)]|uniref:IS4 family transposase n=1 Tax=Paracoccus sp. TaxID=267 RepID=UPI003A85B257
MGGDRAGEIRFTRFLRNPAVSVDEIVATAFERTQDARKGRDVLAIQDTTVTQSSGGGGSFLHAMIAVDAESGAVPGALDAQFMERTEGGKATRRSRAFENRQSMRWLEATQKAGQITGAARVTVVADREADMFGLFAHRPPHVQLLVRATHDRVLMDGGKLADRIANGPRLGYAALDLPARPGRAARAAQLSVRFGRLDLRPPREDRKTCREAVSMAYVDLREETPPEGEKPLHWRLLTTLQVETVADALDVAARYARRWKIEDLFRTMKRRGFDIESLRIRQAEPRNRLSTAEQKPAIGRRKSRPLALRAGNVGKA